MKTIASVFITILLLNSQALLAQQKEKVYRWVDEEGNVHYTETLPPDFQDKQADVLDDQGITREKGISLVPEPPEAKPSPKGELPRDSSGMQRPEPLYSERELQARQDNLLLLRYDNEQEILDAMEVEIKQLAYDRRLLETSRTSLEEAWKGNIREAADRQRAGQPVTPEQIREVESLRRKLASNETSLQGLEQRERNIRADFGAQVERYRELLAAAEEETSGAP